MRRLSDMRRSRCFGLLASVLFGCGPSAGAPVETPPAPEEASTLEVDPPAPASASEAKAPAAPATARATVGRTGTFNADGDLSEWGTATAVDADGLRIWIASEPEGIAIAVRLEGEAAKSTAPLRVMLRSDMPELPPVGFANQFGTTPVPDDAFCDSNGDDEATRTACKTWRTAQLELRGEIAARFDQEAHIGGPDSKADRRTGAARVVEGFIPRADFPAIADWSARALRIGVALDVRRDALAWIETTFDPPIELAPEGSLIPFLFERGALVPGEVVAFVDPSSPDTLHYLLNEPMGYQWQPEQPSPADITVNVADRRIVLQEGDTKVEQLVAAPGFGWHTGEVLVSSRAGRILDVADIGGGSVVGDTKRGGKRVIGVRYEGFYTSFGTGMCGACPLVAFHTLPLGPDGRFGEPEVVVSRGGPNEEEAELTVTPSLDRVELRYTSSDYEVEPPRIEAVEETFRYAPAKGGYEASRRKTPTKPR